ncbi:uncharacterized protein TNCV_2926781 [Trichonephila clavipes]|nr:uncharacterized protein TNCV_2926781 [Trichonephila clavipes]
MQKCQEDLKNSLEKNTDNVEEKINSVEEKIALKFEEENAVEEEKIEKKRVEDLEKKLISCGNEDNERKFVPASPVPVLTSPVSVKLSTCDGKTNWEVYKTQFSIISDANGWTERIRAYQLAASLRGEATEVLQTLPDIERLNFNSLYNALDLRKCVRNLSAVFHGRTVKDEEIQRAVRMVDIEDLKSALLYAPKFEAATQASCIYRHSIRRARVTADAPCESP